MTKNVEDVLQQIVDAYDSWTPEEREQRCADIVDWRHPTKVAGSWDIIPFFRWCHVEEMTVGGKKVTINTGKHLEFSKYWRDTRVAVRMLDRVRRRLRSRAGGQLHNVGRDE